MPHLTIEYSTNLERLAPAAPSRLLSVLHQEAAATGVLPLSGLRTRLIPRRQYRIAEGHPDNVFVAITLRIGPGREVATKVSILDTLTAAASDVLDPEKLQCALSIEITEIDPQFRRNVNKICGAGSQ